MLGLFGTLNLANRSLQTQRQGAEVAGHNLANVNNPAYARQRLNVQTSTPLPSEFGAVGSGVQANGVVQVRNLLLDRQIQNEASIRGSLESEQQALKFMQAGLGQQIDRQSGGAESAAASGPGSQPGLAEHLSGLFNGFQSLSSSPTSMGERQVLLLNAQNLATQFNQTAQRLDNLRNTLNESVQNEVGSANDTLDQIAKLNQQISATELGGRAQANDLRDRRQEKLEELGKFVKVDIQTGDNGAVDLSVDGVSLVSGSKVANRLEAYDAGNGQFLVRSQSDGTPVNLTSGSIQGHIDARDSALASLKQDLDTLAGTVISEVNAVHQPGYSLNNTTGADFFTGSDAASIGVNRDLVDNPTLVQAAGSPDAPGDNQTALALAQLADKKLPALNGQTIQQGYSQIVAGVGQALNSANTQLNNQQLVEHMLEQQRDSVSGVSLDEEMTDLIKYQKAFEASARLVTTIDEFLTTIINLKR